jgi:predicted glutamine amidotransferase
MCKVLFVAGIKKQHQDKVKKLSHEFLKAASTIDDDGFGYAAMTRTGLIYGEKWLRKEDIFVLHGQPKEPAGNNMVTELLGEAAKPLISAPTEKVYDSFGSARTKETLGDTVAIIVHARKKTHGQKSIENCHPFYSPEVEQNPATALVHNGSIMNHLDLTKKTSTCDSEVILHEYLSEAMSYNPWAMPKLAKTLVGQYAVGVLTSAQVADGVQPVLDIFKSAKDLHCAYVQELQTYVFCTAPGLLMKACHEAGMTALGISEVRDGYLIRLDAITGKRLEDIIPFDQSRQFLNGNSTNTGTRGGGTTQHHRPGTHSRTAGMIDITDYTRKQHGPNLEDTVDAAKHEFQKNNHDIFSSPYYDTETGLTKEEAEFYASLEVNKAVDMKALRLVKKVLNF